VERTCADCGAVIPPQKGSARPRKYCEACRPPRNRPNPRVIKLPTPDAEPPATSEHHEPQLVASYRRRLETAERLGTPEGEHVLLLARLLATSEHTAAGAASLSRELRAAMEDALRDAPREADKLDELAARRAAKVAGAS
jgi:hypothetical protein